MKVCKSLRDSHGWGPHPVKIPLTPHRYCADLPGTTGNIDAGVSYFSLSHQMARSEQVEDIARTLARQVVFSLTPLMENNDDNSQKISMILVQLTQNSRIFDAALYQQDGSLIARTGEEIVTRDHLALDGKRVGSYFNHQIVQSINGKDGPIGFLRMTLDRYSRVGNRSQAAQ